MSREMYTEVTGIKMFYKEVAYIFLPTANIIKVKFEMDLNTERVLIYIQMATSTLANGEMIRRTDTVTISMLIVETSTKGALKMVLSRERGFTFGKMGIIIKDNSGKT